jgi:phosphoribosylformylglycinamidine cyclo-ligase
MNIDDLACCGATDNIVLTSTIGRNKRLIPGEVIRAIIQGTEEFLETLRKAGMNIQFAGGETADLGDLVRTIVVDANVCCRMPRSKVVRIRPQPGDLILGVASFGQSKYETEYNGGMGSNGLTSARHDVFSSIYAEKYPESYDAAIPEELRYSGSMLLEDPVEGSPLNAGKLLLSPTRTYTPCLHKVFNVLGADAINGIIHLTGGAHTKILNFIEDLHILKDNPFPPPPLFRLIEQQSPAGRREMYEVFNMGQRLEIYAREKNANRIAEIFAADNFETRMVGKVEASPRKKLTIRDTQGEYIYH